MFANRLHGNPFRTAFMTIVACSLATALPLRADSTLDIIDFNTASIFSVYAHSSDFRYVIGSNGDGLSIWSRDRGTQRIDDFFRSASVSAVSDEGIIVGQYTHREPGPRWMRWDANGTRLTFPSVQGTATDISADGRTIVGSRYDSENSQWYACVWTEHSGTQDIFEIGTHTSIKCSRDGTVVLGVRIGTSGPTLVRWSHETGIEVIGAGFATTYNIQLSGDGNFITQTDYDTDGPIGHLCWTREDGFFKIEAPMGMSGHIVAPMALSYDGSTIVGAIIDPSSELGNFGARGFIWTKRDGTRLLHDVLQYDHGLDLGGRDVWAGIGLSHDAQTIFGVFQVVPSDVNLDYFLARLEPGNSNADSDGDGVPDSSDGCPNDPAKIAPGACGCGAVDTDRDGDGVADCQDACPDDPNKSVPGACGCGVADADADGNGVPDCQQTPEDGGMTSDQDVTPQPSDESPQTDGSAPDETPNGDGAPSDPPPANQEVAMPGPCFCGIGTGCLAPAMLFSLLCRPGRRRLRR